MCLLNQCCLLPNKRKSRKVEKDDDPDDDSDGTSSQSDNELTGHLHVPNNFNTWMAKPGKMSFTVGRKNVDPAVKVQKERKGRGRSKPKSTLPKPARSRSKSKQSLAASAGVGQDQQTDRSVLVRRTVCEVHMRSIWKHVNNIILHNSKLA